MSSPTILFKLPGLRILKLDQGPSRCTSLQTRLVSVCNEVCNEFPYEEGCVQASSRLLSVKNAVRVPRVRLLSWGKYAPETMLVSFQP